MDHARKIHTFKSKRVFCLFRITIRDGGDGLARPLPHRFIPSVRLIVAREKIVRLRRVDLCNLLAPGLCFPRPSEKGRVKVGGCEMEAKGGFKERGKKEKGKISAHAASSPPSSLARGIAGFERAGEFGWEQRGWLKEGLVVVLERKKSFG